MVPCTIVLVLGILFMETLSLPLNLEVSIKGAKNVNTVGRSRAGNKGNSTALPPQLPQRPQTPQPTQPPLPPGNSTAGNKGQKACLPRMINCPNPERKCCEGLQCKVRAGIPLESSCFGCFCDVDFFESWNITRNSAPFGPKILLLRKTLQMSLDGERWVSALMGNAWI